MEQNMKLNIEDEEDSGVCEKCKTSPGQTPHTCPYAEDIGGDSITLCNCCKDCTEECCMDI